MWNGTMFVDLDWPLNASILLSASTELLVSFTNNVHSDTDHLVCLSSLQFSIVYIIRQKITWTALWCIDAKIVQFLLVNYAQFMCCWFTFMFVLFTQSNVGPIVMIARQLLSCRIKADGKVTQRKKWLKKMQVHNCTYLWLCIFVVDFVFFEEIF